MKNTEVKEETEVQKSKESLPLEDRAISASRRVRACGNTTYKMVLELTDTLSPEEAEQMKKESQVRIQQIFNESSFARIEREIDGEKKNCKTLLGKRRDEFETAKNVGMKQHPMPDSFVEKGGTLEEWNNLHPEIQEYEIHGGMEVPIDPTEILLGGLIKTTAIVGVRSASLVLQKGKAFLSGVVDELIPIRMEDAVDFAKYAKKKTEGWVKTIQDFAEEMMSPVGRTPDGFDIPFPQGARKTEMVAKKNIETRNDASGRRMEIDHISDIMDPLDESLSRLKKNLDEIVDQKDKKLKILLKNKAFHTAKKLIDTCDRLVQRFTGFQTEITKEEYSQKGIEEIVQGFRETGRKLDEVARLLERESLQKTRSMQDVFENARDIYQELKENFYDSLSSF